MDSKTKFNRLTVCHSTGAGLDLPPACHSCIILKVFVSPLLFLFSLSGCILFFLLFLCANAEGHYPWSLVISYHNSGYVAIYYLEQAYVFCNCMFVGICVLCSAWVKTEIYVTTDHTHTFTFFFPRMHMFMKVLHSLLCGQSQALGGITHLVSTLMKLRWILF